MIPDANGLYTDADGFISNVPFDMFDGEWEHDAMHGWIPVERPKKSCTCGAAKIGYKELGPAHSQWCDFYKELS